MDKRARRSLYKGLALLLVISIVTVGYLMIRSQVKTSVNSTIAAEEYNVAVDYSGLITQQSVEEGDYVEQGQVLMQIRSTSVLEDLNEERIRESDLLYSLSENKELVIKAQQAGEVKDLAFKEGSFVPANQTLLTISDIDSPYVESYFHLTKEEFDKLGKQTRLQVQLPNSRYVDSKINLITIDDESSEAPPDLIRVRIRSSIEPDGSLLVGSPVVTRLYLETDTLIQRATSMVEKVENEEGN